MDNKDIGLFICSGSKTVYSGVDKKIDAQIKALSLVCPTDKIVIEKEQTNFLKSISWRLPFGSWGAKYSEALEEITEKSRDKRLRFIYIRAQALDRRYLDFLKNLRQRFPDAKVLFEIPTFPYDFELLQDKTMWPWFFKDRYFRRKLSSYVDIIVTFSYDKEIYRIPTIHIQNGIDIDSRNIGDVKEQREDCLNLLAVAQFQKSHGYERIIKGMAKYYGAGNSQNVVLHMVGDGEEKKAYESLVNKCGLNDHVIFHGVKNGKELSNLYQEADIGVGCFGLYKRNIFTISSLKIAEYLAYGLPVITGIKEEIFNKLDSNFFLEFPNDDSLVDISRIVEFYGELVSKHSIGEVRTSIRTFAKENLDITATMGPVLDYLLND